MKAVVFYGKNDVRFEDRPVPKIKDNEVLLRVHACGICGTDVHIFGGDEGAAKTPANTVLGHEFAGEVVEVGKSVTGISVGDHAAADPNVLCGGCDFCRKGIGHFCEHMTGIGTTVDGGFAEYCAVPASQIQLMPKALPFVEAAMTEPVSCCLHGIDLCNIKLGSTVAVIGCGMIGLLMLRLSILSGAAKVIAIEPVMEKREQAMKLGATLCVDPTATDVSKYLSEQGITQVDTVIECVGLKATIEQAISIAGKYSTVMMFGLTKPDDTISVKPFELFKKEIVLKASYINPYTFSPAAAMIQSGRLHLDSMIGGTAPLSELPEILGDPKRRSLGKIVITM